MMPGVMERVRREVERCDCLEGFVTFMSGAGGTGSGLGSLVSEALREEYTKKYRLNQLIWPHQASRDVIIQDYNLIFTLASLYRCSDGILTIQNDHVHSICSRVLGLKDFSFSDMNQVLIGTVLMYVCSKWHEPFGLGRVAKDHSLSLSQRPLRDICSFVFAAVLLTQPLLHGPVSANTYSL